jgi:hypothetical protein
MARKKLLTEGEIRQFMKLANLGPIGAERLSEMGMMPGARDDEMGDEMDAEMGAEMDAGGDEDMEMDLDMGMDAEGGGDMVSMDDFMSALERAIEEVTGEEADVSEDPGEEEMDMGGDDMDMDMAMDDDEEPMMEQRKGHGGGARSADSEKNKPGKFGKPDEEKPDKYASGEGAAPDEEPVRRGRKSSGHRPDKMEEGEELDERRADDMRARRDKMATKSGERGKFGAPDEEEEDSMAHGAGAGKGEKAQRYKGSAGRRPSGGQAKGFGRMSEEEIVSEVAQRVAARLQAENSREQMVDQLAERIMKRLVK